MTEEEKHPLSVRVGWSFGAFADVIAYQSFTYLIFLFYFLLMKINATWITLGFIIWSVWNALNDPMIGLLSDRTKSKWGRRKPWIVAATIPLALIMFFLWTPPLSSELSKFLYFLFIIMAFDGIYTMFSLNHTSLFPEMFIDEKSRASVNKMRQTFNVVGLIVAVVLPTLLISDLTNKYEYPYTQTQFMMTGAILGVVVLVAILILIKWGIKEKKEFSQDAYKTPSIKKAFKYTLKNRSFLFYVVAALMTWYIYGILLPIVPLYGTYVLNIGADSLLLSVLLLVAFLMAIPGFYLWKKVGHNFGIKKGMMISMLVWIAALSPLLFASDFIFGVITMAFVGIGLAGSMYYIDLLISDVIDEDELKTGVRREGGYYGINALIIRLSTILTFITIALVLSTNG